VVRALFHSFARLFVAGIFGALALILLWAGPRPAALASSEGSVVISPSSGPVGTAVEADISLSFDPPQSYTLTATSTDPAQGGCASAQPIPGVGPVTVGQQGGHAQFSWPSAFASGQYWLCASPQGGSGPSVPSAHSLQPYTVTAANAPSPTPVIGGHLDQSHTYVDAPNGDVTAGSTVTVIVTGWVTPDDAAPTTVKLVLPDSSTVGVPFTIGPKSSPQDGSYALAVTVPASMAPGEYTFEIDGAYQATTAPFQVIAPVTATAVATPIRARGQPIPPSDVGIPALAIGAAVAALLVLAGALLVIAARGRKWPEAERRPHDRGDDYATRHLADGYGMRHQREEMRRR
jgi:hypothetical protein